MMTAGYLRTGRNWLLSVLAAAVLLAGWVLSGSLIRFIGPGGISSTPQHVNFATVPVAFVPNEGPAPSSVSFTARSQAGALAFSPSEVVLSMQSTSAETAATTGGNTQANIALRFLGAAPATISQGDLLPGKVNYLLGNDPSKWQHNLPTYSSILYTGLYPGVTLAYSGEGRDLKGTYTVAAGADWTRIRWSYVGAQSVTKDVSGNLQIALSASQGQGSLTELAPTAWQEIDGTRSQVTARYVVAADGSISFALGNYNPNYEVTIDPTLTFSTYIGGSLQDDGMSIAVDSANNMYITGITPSTNFPTVNAYQPSILGAPDAFVTKFNSNGTVAYSTYLGGNGTDYGYGIAVDGTNRVFIGGKTTSTNFPTRNAYMSTIGGNIDAFLTVLNSTGSDLVYSTYYGGSGTDFAWGLAMNSSGAYIAGEASSTNLPTRNGYQTTLGGSNDAFVAKFNVDLIGDASFLYGTYLGGSQDDFAGGRVLSDVGHGVAADTSGNIYLTGQTMSANFPVRNAFQSTFAGNGNPDAWAAKIDSTLSGNASLIYSTYLGGIGSDAGRDVAVDSSGYAYITGDTGSTTFPTRTPYASCFGNLGPFVMKVNMALSGNASLIYSTCFGSGGYGHSSSIFVDTSGHAFITGNTPSSTFPQVHPMQSYSGGQDAFVLELVPAGNDLVFSSYLGGAASDAGYDIAEDNNNNSYIVGSTFSTNFPVVNPQYTPAGSSDAFVSRIDNTIPSTFTAIPTNTRTITPTRVPTQPPGSPTRRPTFTPAPTFTPGPTNTATFTPGAGTPTPLPCTINFSDVHTSDYFYQPVSYLYCHGAISGYADGTFRPYNNTTRSQLVKIVVLAENWVLTSPGTPTFSDVPQSNPFYTYIETAVQRQIISGYGDGTFRPFNNVTRGQLCKIISIAERWVIIDPVYPRFTDVGVDNPFYVFIETAAAQNVISGYADGTFRWGNDATRGQLSKIIYNAVTQP